MTMMMEATINDNENGNARNDAVTMMMTATKEKGDMRGRPGRGMVVVNVMVVFFFCVLHTYMSET
jgi:hypothetical protein